MIFEALNERHDLSRFRCGNSMLDTYLRRDALKEQEGDLARVFVAIGEEGRPIGFFALKTTGAFIEEVVDEVPAAPGNTIASGAFLYPAEIGCLARDLGSRGQGLGEVLLLEALRRIERATREIGLPGVFLTATKEGASLYEGFGFLRVDASAPDYYLPMSHVREILRESGVA